MDYILQAEKIFTYLKFNFELPDCRKINLMKRGFNSDYNLFGCFIKDFLILKTGKRHIEDDKIYELFVLYFEENITTKERILNELKNYSEYYLMIVFEKCENPEILSAISTINLCYCMEVYPILLEILDNYFNDIVDVNITIKMLKSLVSIVLYRFESEAGYDIDFKEELRKSYKKDFGTFRKLVS